MCSNVSSEAGKEGQRGTLKRDKQVKYTDICMKQGDSSLY